MNSSNLEPKYILKDFFFGDSDGKNEANYNSDFLKYYYTGLGYQDILIENPKSWLILGRKGTGKSLLGWYFHGSLNKMNNFSSVISYKDFRYSLLDKLENGDINPNQYISIWKFLLFLYLGKEILKDLSLESNSHYQLLKNFIEGNFDFELDQNRVLDQTISKGIKGDYLLLGGNITSAETNIFGSYLNYLDKLEEVIITLISESKNDFYLILDELDDRFRRNDENKDKLISLIKSINHINSKIYFSTQKKSKIICLLRTDIFTCLKDTDLNKIKTDNGIIINWESKINIHSELFKMLIHKIKQSKTEYLEEDNYSIFKMLFPDYQINYRPPEKYFLERTFFRPRDIISFINIIVKKYPYTKYIGFKAFKDAENEYSKYLLSEIENEIIGHYQESFIENTFRLLKQFGRNQFSYNEIKAYYAENSLRFDDLDIDSSLEMLFEFGVIGNVWKSGDKTFHSSIIRDERAIIDFNKNFVLHLGIRRALLS